MNENYLSIVHQLDIYNPHRRKKRFKIAVESQIKNDELN